MRSYNVHEAKSNLSRLLKEMAGGEKVVIMRDGKPVAELVPYREPRPKKRRLGFAAGGVGMPDGWERPMTDEEADAFLDGRLW
jgi:prevent-host-death family protein